MIGSFVGQMFGTKNERELKRMRRMVDKINALEPELQKLSDEQIKAKTTELKAAVSGGKSLDDVLVEAFAVCREASVRTLGMRHFDVQLIGGVTLHEGKIAEMRTGEGKTLMSTLACYLNALGGKSVHVVTVNDYLAGRDAELNRPLFEFLGLSVGVIYSMQPGDEKAHAYRCDITYGTNNEFGFDYLRDNMVFAFEEKKQRGLSFAIVDEIDSILIDEARTPLIISGASEDSSRLYALINQIIPKLKRAKTEEGAKENTDGHFWVDEKNRQIEINEAGYELIEAELQALGELGESESLYSPSRLNLLHHVQAAIRGHHLFVKNVQYIVNDGEVVIVDENTGRTMPGRRWSEGLHQAVEAKEGLEIKNENQTLATTTFQNYFRLYDKLSGMTGTADTEASEFKQTYGLDVVVIPTHKPMVRQDLDDQIFLTKAGKYQGIIKVIKEIQEKGAPVLVGTATIEASEDLSALLTAEKISHNVLNAKQHEREAEIIAQAGSPGRVTIATNMAGRGTDIILGGNWQEKADALTEAGNPPDARMIEQLKAQWKLDNEAVKAAGGLHIIGSERHESRRIDNQLRGRAGRQGDPGMSRFFLSLEDDLMRIFAGDRVAGAMRSMGLKEDEAIEARMVSRSIENAQRKVEARDFDARKNLLKYDDVANEQRKVIYRQRDQVLKSDDLSSGIEQMYEQVISGLISQYIPYESVEDQWDVKGLEDELDNEFHLKLPLRRWLKEDRRLDEQGLRAKIYAAATERFNERRAKMGDQTAHVLERHFMLRSLDKHWKEHLAQMDHLRRGIHLRGYAQKQPEQEYKRESFDLFKLMIAATQSEVAQDLSQVHIPTQEELAALEAQRQAQSLAPSDLDYIHEESDGLSGQTRNDPELAARNAQAHAAEGLRIGAKTGSNPYANQKVSRNAPCPCGSGKKYKNCHGKAL